MNKINSNARKENLSQKGGRSVRHQRVPAFRPPAFRDAVALEHQVVDATVAKMLAHGDTGLAGANNERVYFFN